VSQPANQALDLDGSNIGRCKVDWRSASKRLDRVGKPALRGIRASFEQLDGAGNDSRHANQAICFVAREAPSLLSSCKCAFRNLGHLRENAIWEVRIAMKPLKRGVRQPAPNVFDNVQRIVVS